MKSFNLICDQGHSFELMVKSDEALADQQARGLVTCPYCDSPHVSKGLARPTVSGGKGRGHHTIEAVPVSKSSGPAPSQAEFEKAYKFFSEMRTKVEKTHEDVGEKFTDQARAMHYGEIEERGIYGSASADQVKDMIDEGLEIAPLPNLPKHNA